MPTLITTLNTHIQTQGGMEEAFIALREDPKSPVKSNFVRTFSKQYSRQSSAPKEKDVQRMKTENEKTDKEKV